MSWKITEHKRKSTQQELQVCIKIRELEESWSTESEGLISAFKSKLLEIKKTNSFEAQYGYVATPRNPKSVEIWKVKVNGDFDYKMFTLNYVGENPNPFNF